MFHLRLPQPQVRAVQSRPCNNAHLLQISFLLAVVFGRNLGNLFRELELAGRRNPDSNLPMDQAWASMNIRQTK